MEIQYIAGRAFKIGADNIGPGDTLTRKQLDSIPRLESWIGSRHIFRIVSEKDYDRLPQHIYAQVRTKAEAEAVIFKNTASVHGENPEVAAALEAGKNDHLTKKASAQMGVQDFIYESHRVGAKKAAANIAAQKAAQDGEGTDTGEADKSVAENDSEKQIGDILPKESSETPDTFDPSEHSVAEVKAYIEEHPEEAQAVLEAESDGKARKTLLEY